MSRPVIEVELNGVASIVRGFGSRRLCEEVTGRPPVYVRPAGAHGGWSVQESTARDVIAASERAGYDVLIVGPRACRSGPDQGASFKSPIGELKKGGKSPIGDLPEVIDRRLW